jgi:hypothetical protein
MGLPRLQVIHSRRHWSAEFPGRRRQVSSRPHRLMRRRRAREGAARAGAPGLVRRPERGQCGAGLQSAGDDLPVPQVRRHGSRG